MLTKDDFWKLGAMLYCSILPYPLFDPMSDWSPLAASVLKLSFLVAAFGVFQFAFGWPRLPVWLWRIFAPPFLFGWLKFTGFSVGWLATRLATRNLTIWAHIDTAAYLALYALLAVVVAVPLISLGRWRELRLPGSKQASAEASAIP